MVTKLVAPNRHRF